MILAGAKIFHRINVFAQFIDFNESIIFAVTVFGLGSTFVAAGLRQLNFNYRKHTCAYFMIFSLKYENGKNFHFNCIDTNNMANGERRKKKT